MAVAARDHVPSLRRNRRKTVSGVVFCHLTAKKAQIWAPHRLKLAATVARERLHGKKRTLACWMRKNPLYKTVYSTVTQGPCIKRKRRKTVFTSKTCGFSSKTAGEKHPFFGAAENAVFSLNPINAVQGGLPSMSGNGTIGIRKIR